MYPPVLMYDGNSFGILGQSLALEPQFGQQFISAEIKILTLCLKN